MSQPTITSQSIARSIDDSIQLLDAARCDLLALANAKVQLDDLQSQQDALEREIAALKYEKRQ